MLFFVLKGGKRADEKKKSQKEQYGF